MVTGSLGLAMSSFRQIAAAAALRSAAGLVGVAQDQGAPVAERVGVVGLGLVEGLVLRGGLGVLLVAGELGDQGQPQVAPGGGELDRLLVPGLGLGGPAHAGQSAAQPDQGLDVLGLFLGPAFVIGDQAGLVVVAEEDFLDLAADLAMEPAIGAELGQHGLEVAEGLVGSSEPDLQVGGLHGELDLAEGVGGFLGERLEARQSRRRAGSPRRVRMAICSCDAWVVGEEGFEPVPDLEGLVGFLGALVDAAQGLEDFEEVVARGLSLKSALRRRRRPVRAGRPGRGPGRDNKGAGGRRVGWSRPARRAVTAAASWPRWTFEEPEDQPAGAILGILGDAVLVGLDEGVERAALDVVAVDAVERGAAAGVLLEEREEAFHGALLARLLGRGGIGDAFPARLRSLRRRGRSLGPRLGVSTAEECQNAAKQPPAG